MRHVTLVNESCHTRESFTSHQWVTSHVELSFWHVTHIHGSCHSHMRMTHNAHMEDPYVTTWHRMKTRHTWVHAWIQSKFDICVHSNVTQLWIYDWLTRHKWVSPGGTSHMNSVNIWRLYTLICEKWLGRYEQLIRHTPYVTRRNHLKERRTWIQSASAAVPNDYLCVWIHMCDMYHSYGAHEFNQRSTLPLAIAYLYTFIRVTWFTHEAHINSVGIWDYPQWLPICMYSYVWHDSFIISICVRWLIRISFIRVNWLIHVFDMTHSYVWRDSFIWRTWI